MATSLEKWSFVKPLIERKIDVDLTDSGGATALMYAALCGHSESVDLMISAGADPTIQNLTGITALDLAIKSQQDILFRSCQSQGNYNKTILLLTQLKL